MADIIVSVDFDCVDFGIFCSIFRGCVRLLVKLKKWEGVVICGCIPEISVGRGAI